MFEKGLIAYIFTETSVHPGSGATISGIVDLPIQRERHTEFPMIQGSSLKGVLRNYAETLKIKCEGEIFGEEDQVGGISVTDARILAFPVRALKGVFGWVTCPLILSRYKRDLRLANIEVGWSIEDLKPEKDEEVIIKKNSNLKSGNYIYIEELQLEAKCESIENIANEIKKGLPNSEDEIIKNKLEKDLVIVSNNVFRDIVSLTTEVTARIKTSRQTGTVEEGGLWYEEYLPPDTLMYSLILIPNRLNTLQPKDVEQEIRKYDEKPLQIGGDETIGKGFTRIKLIGSRKNA